MEERKCELKSEDLDEDYDKAKSKECNSFKYKLISFKNNKININLICIICILTQMLVFLKKY